MAIANRVALVASVLIAITAYGILPAESPKNEDKVQSLMVARRDVLLRLYLISKEDYLIREDEGHGFYLETLEKYRDAELALTADKVKRVRIMETIVEEIKKVESTVKSMHSGGVIPVQDLLWVTARRLQAEICLECEKRG
jgi:hypothetical protein